MSRGKIFGTLSVVVFVSIVIGLQFRNLPGDALGTTCYIEQGMDVTPTTCPATFQGGLCSAPYTMRVNFTQPGRFTGAPHVIVTPRNVSNQDGCVGTKTDRLVCRPKTIDSGGFTLECSGSPLRDDCGVTYDNYFSYASADWIAVDPSCGARSGHDVTVNQCTNAQGGVCGDLTFWPVTFQPAFTTAPKVFVTPEELTVDNACASGTFDAVRCAPRDGSITNTGFVLECSGSPLDTVSTCGAGNGMWASAKAGWFAMEDRSSCKVVQGSALTDNCTGTSVTGGLCQGDWQKQVVFPAGAFSAPPFVQISPNHISASTQCANGSTEKIVCTPSNVTAGGFLATCRGMPAGTSCSGSDAGTPTEFNYIAMAASCVGTAPTESDIAIGGNGFPSLPTTVQSPAQLQVDFSVTNNGPATSGTVRIIPTFGTNLSFISITDAGTPNVVCSSALNCSISNLASGQTRNFAMNLNVSGTCPATTAGNSITLEPLNFTDPNPANNAMAARSFGITCGPGQPASSSSPTQMFNAACVSATVPSLVGSQSAFTATITIRNTGSEEWRADQFDLTPVTPSVFQTPASYGILTDVLPQQTKSITVAGTAPLLPGTYPFQWQVRERNGAAFGATCGGNVTVGPPSADMEVVSVSGSTVLQKGGAPGMVEGVLRNKGTFSTESLSAGAIFKLRNLPAGITVTGPFSEGVVQCSQSGSTNVYCTAQGMGLMNENGAILRTFRFGLEVAESVPCNTVVTYTGTTQAPSPYSDPIPSNNSKTATRTGVVQCPVVASSSTAPATTSAPAATTSAGGTPATSAPAISSAITSSAVASQVSSSLPRTTSRSSSSAPSGTLTYCCNNNQCVQSTSCTMTLAACTAACKPPSTSASVQSSSSAPSSAPIAALPPAPPQASSAPLPSSSIPVFATCQVDLCAAGGTAYCAQLQATCRRTQASPCYECVPLAFPVSAAVTMTSASRSSLFAAAPAIPPPMPVVPSSTSSRDPSLVLQVPGQSSSMPPIAIIPAGCGNAITENQEQCDFGSGNSNSPNAVCRSNCTYARCGDGVVDTQKEACDDGNTASGDGCDAQCRIVPVEQTLPQQIAQQPIVFQPLPAQLAQAPVQFAPLSLPAVSAYMPPSTVNSGPATMAMMAAGAAAGIGWMRRRKK